MSNFIASLKILIIFTLITGILYPLLITGIAMVVFPSKANGSLVMKDNQVVGSTLIGQVFDSSIYFSSRPSAVDYNPIPSGGSNLGSTNKVLIELVNNRRQLFITENSLDAATYIPSEMFFASASGLDPHIPVEGAMLQVERIVKARKFTPNQKKELYRVIKNNTEPPQLLILGEERVNVFMLNLDLDEIK